VTISAMMFDPTKFRLANRRNSTIGALTRSSTSMKTPIITIDPASKPNTDVEPQPHALPSMSASTNAVSDTVSVATPA